MIPRFSSRTSWSLAENALAQEIRALRAAGADVVDLAASNPTRVGLGAPEGLVSLLADERGRRYAPEPLGLLEARQAIAADARRRGRACDPDRLVLSASTSEAYTWIWKLVCEPGDEVLVPSPSYPLFSYLCDVEGVRARSYPLLRDEAFRIDVGAIARAVGERTRAVVVVHPNNPTGTFARRDDAEALDALAAERGLVIVSDEVFADYPFGPLKGTKLPTFAGPRAALTFVLSGLSKVACAPQLKLGWTSVHGDDEAVRLAMSRLEVIADTFLSVSTPVQVALPAILERVPRIQEEVLARLRENLAAIDRAIEARGPHAPVRRLDADGGWSALLEVARTRTEDEWASSLLREHGVIVQPGYFYDMDREGFLVVSLLPEPERFRAGIERVVDVLARA